MDQIISKLVDAAVAVFADGCRFQVPFSIFDSEDDVRRFINKATDELGTPIRASSNAGAITFYEDDGLTDGKEVVVLTVGQ